MDWYYQVRDDDPAGPITDAQLWQLVADGQVPPLARVRRGDSGPWHFAAELRSLLARESPPRPERKRSRLSAPALVALGAALAVFLPCVIFLGQSEPPPTKTEPPQYIIVESPDGPGSLRTRIGPHPASLLKSQRPPELAPPEWPGWGPSFAPPEWTPAGPALPPTPGWPVGPPGRGVPPQWRPPGR